MKYEKPLIFIYPISDTLSNLKKAIEASGQPLEIYCIDDLRELLQTVPALGQSLVLGSNAKKCAKFLQAAKKIIKQNDTKVIIISQKQYPRKTVDKLMKFGLNDIIFEPVPAKTLMYKVNLALRALKVPSKQELEKKFKAEQAAKENGDDEQSFGDDDDDIENEDGDNTEKKISGSSEDSEESEEELLNSLNKQKPKAALGEEGFDENDVDSGESEYERRMKELEGSGDDEDEESLLDSMQNQKISKGDDDEQNEVQLKAGNKDTGDEDQSQFDPNDLDSGNSEMDVETVHEIDGDDDGYSEEDEMALLDDMPTANSIKDSSTVSDNEISLDNNGEAQSFDTDGFDTDSQEQDTDFGDAAVDIDGPGKEGAEEDYDPFAQTGDDDDEETISLADLSMAPTGDNTNVEGEAENLDTHMAGEGSTEHIEDEEHQMSESEMEFEEMAALSEISNLDTKMKGQGSADAEIDDNMQGDVANTDVLSDHMAGEVNYDEEELGDLAGEVNYQEEQSGDMAGDVLGDGEVSSNMVGDISLDDLMGDGALEGATLGEEEQSGNLAGEGSTDHIDDGDMAGELYSKEKNIKTHYDAEGIDHQNEFEGLEGAGGAADEYEDEGSSLLVDDISLDDLMGSADTEHMDGNLKGDVGLNTENPDGDFEGLISEDPQAENLKGRGSTDKIEEGDFEGTNNSMEADKGGMKGHQDGTEHIETNYGTDFASEIDKKKKQNPLMEFDAQDDHYGETEFAKAKKKSALDMYQEEDLYGQNGHTKSLAEDKKKRATDDFQDGMGADTGFDEFQDPKKKAHLEMQYEMHDVEYDENGDAITPMQEFDEFGKPLPKVEQTYDENGKPIPKPVQEYDENGDPKRPDGPLEMQYELESDWSQQDRQLKAKYSLEELDNIPKKLPKVDVPKMSLEEQYQVYDDMDLDNLIDDFGGSDDMDDEHIQELKEMAKDLKSTIYDDFEPEMVVKLANVPEDDFVPKEKDNTPPPAPIDYADAMGLDTLISISQFYQTVTLKAKDAVYQSAKTLWNDHKGLTCFLHIDGSEVSEFYNSITDPIVSDDYVEPEMWDTIKIKVLQDHKKKDTSFWDGPDEEGTPKLFFAPYFEQDTFYGGTLFFFPNNIPEDKRGLIESYAEALKMISFSSLPQDHSLKVKIEAEENKEEKESVFGKAKGFFKENFVEEKVDKESGKKGSRFGNWVKNKIEKIAS